MLLPEAKVKSRSKASVRRNNTDFRQQFLKRTWKKFQTFFLEPLYDTHE